MASTYVGAGEDQPPSPVLSPRLRSPRDRELRRSWSSNSSTCSHGTAAATPKCVCAPPTHAGSFKCRLHRVNSQSGNHSAPTTPLNQPPPAVSSASTWTVEAQ